MSEPIRILIVEDMLTDAELAEREIGKVLQPCAFRRVDTREDYLAALESFQPDLIVSDYKMPRFDGLTALTLALERAPLTPLIMLTGSLNEDTAVECMRAGATDYVIKEHIKRLGSAVLRALDDKQVRRERRQAADALRESEARFRSLYENATIGLYRTTPGGRILMANPTAVRMLGYATFDELVQRNLEQDGYEPTYPRSEFRQRLEREGVITGFESAWIKKDGSTIFVRESARAIRDEHGQVLYYDGTFEDITEHKHLEQALRLTQFCVDQASIAIFRTGPDARIQSANDQACRLLGYTAAELLNLYIYDIDPDFPLDKWLRHRQALRTRGSQTFETTHRRKDGALIPVEVTSNYLEYQGEEFSFSFVRDISERKQAEAAVRRLNTELEERVRERTAQLEAANTRLQALGQVKDEFVSNVSHELRTPLANFKLYLGLLSLRPDKYDAYLATLERETKRLENLIEGLLVLSRLDQDRQTLSLAALDLNALVKEYVTDRSALAESKGLTLTFDPASVLNIARADRNLAGQALSILLTNAFNYTPAGGRVIVRTQTRSVDGQPWVGFSVSDTGPGIPPDEQAQLFTRFFRGRTGRESGVPGTGLGLSIVKKIVDRHHGRIDVESVGVPGQGATFCVWLPAWAS
jgi:PAS domain S-box-containing protein